MSGFYWFFLSLHITVKLDLVKCSRVLILICICYCSDTKSRAGLVDGAGQWRNIWSTTISASSSSFNTITQMNDPSIRVERHMLFYLDFPCCCLELEGVKWTEETKDLITASFQRSISREWAKEGIFNFGEWFLSFNHSLEWNTLWFGTLWVQRPSCFIADVYLLPDLTPLSCCYNTILLLWLNMKCLPPLLVSWKPVAQQVMLLRGDWFMKVLTSSMDSFIDDIIVAWLLRVRAGWRNWVAGSIPLKGLSCFQIFPSSTFLLSLPFFPSFFNLFWPQ